jgi:putative glycosyltransferase (TIGR04372 family)
MRAPKVVDFYTAAWPDFTPALTLRKVLYAVGRVDVDMLRVFAESAPNRDYRIRSFIAAALLANNRVDLEKVNNMFINFENCKDNFEITLAIISKKIKPSSVSDAFDIIRLKGSLIGILSSAGFFRLKDIISLGKSEFIRRIRRNLYKGEIRGFTDQWTFAIGHLVLLLFLIKGQSIGVSDFRTAEIWRGGIANRVLWNNLLVLSKNVKTVPKGSVFADHHDSSHHEWMDGRFVDYFEACGIVADRSGEACGAILDRPSQRDPALLSFFDATGMSPGDQIVTLHCREGGFRAVGASSLRDVDITAYRVALIKLVEQGYQVIRLGDSSMTPLPPIAGVFDYAVSELKSEALDILLPGIASFHIGSSSGLSLVPLLYGTPCLFLNWHPFDLLPWGRRNWTVVKPIHSSSDGRLVVERRAYGSLGRIRERSLLNTFGYDIRDLSAVEIERAVMGFVETIEADLPEPPKVGLNQGRVLTVNDRDELQDLQ